MISCGLALGREAGRTRGTVELERLGVGEWYVRLQTYVPRNNVTLGKANTTATGLQLSATCEAVQIAAARKRYSLLPASSSEQRWWHASWCTHSKKGCLATIVRSTQLQWFSVSAESDYLLNSVL
jgi:hypothetical protein